VQEQQLGQIKTQLSRSEDKQQAAAEAEQNAVQAAHEKNALVNEAAAEADAVLARSQASEAAHAQAAQAATQVAKQLKVTNTPWTPLMHLCRAR
jgi:DNA repair exonuclease SbcCD ATPase subunit